MTERERREREWLEGEVKLSASLTDADRIRILRDLLRAPQLAGVVWRVVQAEMFGPWHPFHHRVLDRSPARDVEGRSIRIHAAEDLIGFKTSFARRKDIGAVEAVVMA